MGSVEHVRLVYEDDLERKADQARTVNDLIARIGLLLAPTSTRYWVRVHPTALRDMVTNADALTALLRGGHHEHHLDDRGPAVGSSQT